MIKSNNKTITVMLCDGRIVGQHAEHDITPVQITFPAKIGPKEAIAKLLDISCLTMDRYDGVRIHGKKYALYFVKYNQMCEELIATYPLRDIDGKIYYVVAGSVVLVREDEPYCSLNISKKDWLTLKNYLHEQNDMASLAIFYKQGCHYIS